jgi:uncharacterized delta-60 repeat protein
VVAKVSRWLVLVVAWCCAFLISVGPVSARGHLDRSFGEDGIVDLTRDLAPGGSIGLMATAPDDGIVFTEEHWDCDRSCAVEVGFLRYRPDGRLDRGFGERAGTQARHGQGNGTLAIDSAGRVLYAWKAKEGRIVIRRLRSDGTRDRSFGRAGKVVLRCDCWVGSLAALPGGGLLVSGNSELDEVEGLRGARWFFARLSGDGSLDHRFGGDGIVRLRMRGYSAAGFDLTPGGGLALGGDLWSGASVSPAFVSRLSGRGQLDRSYTERATRALRGVHGTRRDGYGWQWMTVVARPGGKVLVYADAFESGVAVRLLRNGRRDRSFGSGGVRVLPLTQTGVATDAAGGMILAGYLRPVRRFVVMRLRPDGNVDRRYGVLRLGGFGEDGPALSALPGGGAIVFDRGIGFCRSECAPPEPRVYKVLP